MIPMRNRKKTLEVTMEEMRNFSFAYIEKYAPSKQQLRTYLLKKYLKANVPNVKKQDITDLIDIVLVDLEKSKFISDKFYSESKSRSLIQKGSSINKIRYLFISKPNKKSVNTIGVPNLEKTAPKKFDAATKTIINAVISKVLISASCNLPNDNFL